jgi:hypothetical protein
MVPVPEVVLPALQWLAFTSVLSAVVLAVLDGVREGLK